MDRVHKLENEKYLICNEIDDIDFNPDEEPEMPDIK